MKISQDIQAWFKSEIFQAFYAKPYVRLWKCLTKFPPNCNG